MNVINKSILKIIAWVSCISIMASMLSISSRSVSAQGTDILWSAPVNISNSEGLVSINPFLLSDPSGVVHLFWAEKVLADYIGEQPDTIMYTQWDGTQWSKPIDIFFAPPEDINLIADYPHAVIDDNGKIHLIWFGEPIAPNYALYYSSAHASQAKSPRAWQPRVTLADDLTGTQFSIYIAYTPPETLHIIYARVPGGDFPPEERAVTYIQSIDGGENWSEPVDIYTTPFLDRGASNTVLAVEPPDKVYASWSEWDDSGNGQAIYFMRSLDNGKTWDPPVRLAERIGMEYERDWNNLASVGPNEIVSIWEGGWRAYRGAMYSSDGGVTWSEPVDVFPFLIGDNGRVEFARDSLGRLHLFIAQRIREGYAFRGDLMGLWHSVWEGGTQWKEPTFEVRDANTTTNMFNPKAVVVNGNQIVTAWFGYQVYEIFVMTGVIPSAPEVPPKPWPLSASLETQVPTQQEATPQVASTAEPPPLFINTDVDPEAIPNNATSIMFGVVIALVLVISIAFVQIVKARKRSY